MSEYSLFVSFFNCLAALIKKPPQPQEISAIYPQNFDIDAMRGQKFIYSEPVLPEIECNVIKKYIKSREHLFNELEKSRNTLITLFSRHVRVYKISFNT